MVVILDLLAMIRSQRASGEELARLAQGPATVAEVTRPALVMVVDDSVTVRKVTSRLLERHGMEVFTAKEGWTPSPSCRSGSRTSCCWTSRCRAWTASRWRPWCATMRASRDLPIVMITSRTGEKHRERALSLGVNEYLGKPYQESELLAHIHRLVREHD